MNSPVVASSLSETKPTPRAHTADDDPPDSPPEGVSSTIPMWIDALDWFAVGLVALVSVLLHVRFVTHVGGLWRDEANSVQLATLPRLSDIWHYLDFDSFPLLFCALLRLWTGMFGAHNDGALRVLGLLIGFGVLTAIWITSRSLGAGKPVLSLAIIGLNPMLIRYGDSTRAYGLGILLILFTFAGFWRLVASRSVAPRKRVMMAALLAILSVQCVYYNSVLLLAIIAAAIVVSIRRGAWRTAAIALAIGISAAACLLPYVPAMRRIHEWTYLVHYPVDLRWLWRRGCEVLGSPDPLLVWVWSGLFLTGIALVAASLLPSARKFGAPTGWRSVAAFSPRLPDAVLFAGVALIVAVPGYAAFLRVLKYYTQPWYYIMLAAFVACALDVVFGAWSKPVRFGLSFFLRATRPLVAIGLVCLTTLPDWKDIATRHTNIDLVAAQLRSAAGKDDIVLVPQWENAVSLSYYYSGPAELITIPNLPDHRFHRYDLVSRQMGTDAVQPIRERLEKILRSNHSVFIAGSLHFPPASLHLLKAPREPARGKNGENNSHIYFGLWQLQVGQFLRTHALQIDKIGVPIPDNAAVQSFEDVELQVVQGWRNSS